VCDEVKLKYTDTFSEHQLEWPIELVIYGQVI